MTDEHRALSFDNSKKLDQLILLIQGETDAPGILARIALIEAVLFGRHGKDGLVTKVNFMWRAHIWILCAISGVFGFLFRQLLLKLYK
jgi:hypothetical protein